MKAISLWQPWASLIACGAKPFETRHWAPPRELIGQTIAIHAAKKIDRDAVALAQEIYMDRRYEGVVDRDKLFAMLKATPPAQAALFGKVFMPVGCVVCTVRLDAAFMLGEPAAGTAVPAASVMRRLISRPMPDCFTVRYDDFGDYAPGRWAWLLRDPHPLNPPAPIIGRQGFFELPQGWMCEASPS